MLKVWTWGLPLRCLRIVSLYDIGSQDLNWWSYLTYVCPARDLESGFVRLDGVVLLGLIKLVTSGAGRISTGTSSLDARGCVAVKEIHWLGLSLSGDEVRVWFRLYGETWVPVCLGAVI